MDPSKCVLELVKKKQRPGLTEEDRIKAINCLVEELKDILRYTTAWELGDRRLRRYLYTDGSHSLESLRQELKNSTSQVGNLGKILSARGFYSRHFTPHQAPSGCKEFASIIFSFDRDGKWHAYRIMLKLVEGERPTGKTVPVSITEERGDIPKLLTDQNGKYLDLNIKLDDLRQHVVNTMIRILDERRDMYERAQRNQIRIDKIDFLVRHILE